MYFIDGENLTIRWKNQHLGQGQDIPPHVTYEPDVFVWSEILNMRCHRDCNIIRKHYYTSVKGDTDRRNEISDKLRSLGIEAPNVFPRKNTGSKRVDISLSVEMLTHAYQKNCDVAILVAGDEDYVPLVNAVKNTGCRVFLWFVDSGLNPALKQSVDYYFDIANVLCNPDAPRYFSW